MRIRLRTLLVPVILTLSLIGCYTANNAYFHQSIAIKKCEEQ